MSYQRNRPSARRPSTEGASIQDIGISGISASTPYDHCLRPFVEALGWTGEPRHIVEAFPHLEPIMDFDSFRAVVGRLGYSTRAVRLSLDEIRVDQLPVLIDLPDKGPIVLIPGGRNNQLLAFDPRAFDLVEIERGRQNGLCCIAEPIESAQPADQKNHSKWIANSVQSIYRPLWSALAITFLANILGLATPIFVMVVYDSVISTKSADTLVLLLFGFVAVVAFEVYLRKTKGLLIAYLAARLSAGLMTASLGRLLSLPVGMTESAPVNVQILRLKQFESLHGLFVGPIASAILDLPFTLLFFIAIAFVDPLLAVIPILLVALYAVLTAVTITGARRRLDAMNASNSANLEFITEAIRKRTSIKQLRAEAEWISRFTPISRELAENRYRVQFFDSSLSTTSQSMVSIGGVTTLLIGAHLVMAGDLSTGGLIAVMMFIWRVLSPIQVVYNNLTKIDQFTQNIKQLRTLMQLQTEHPSGPRRFVLREFEGRITLSNVGFRYTPDQEPIFRGLSLDIPPGQMIGISSENAGGKSTILKLIMGLHLPQAGGIFLDGLNLRQLDPREVREAIAYLPQHPVFFYGTIAQNMRLCSPAATDEEIRTALGDASVDIDSDLFPDGIDTRMTRQFIATLPEGVLQCLSLARLYCKPSKIYLLNDPTAYLDAAGSAALARQLQKLRQKATIVLVSNRESQLRSCDRVVKLADGAIADDSNLTRQRQRQEQKAVA